MPIGPGKYDDLCSIVREGAGITGEGGVIVIVLGGTRGGGFSVQADMKTIAALPDILDAVATEIRGSFDERP